MAQSVDTRLKEAEIARFSAQAAAFSAQAKVFLSESKQRVADTRDANASAAQTEMETRDYEIDFRQKQRLEKEVLALDSAHHVYRLTGPISSSSDSGMEMFGISSPDTVTPALDRLNYWLRTAEENLTIEFVINSPGGEVMAAMELFDKILEVRAAGHIVITKAAGLAASAASTLMQAGTIREGGPNSFQVIHEPSTGVHGKIGVIRDEIKFLERISDRVANIYVDRSVLAGAPHPLTLKYFKSQWKDHDWSLDANEAYNLGIIDRISGQAPAVTETSARRRS